MIARTTALALCLVLAGCSDGPPSTSDESEFEGIDTTAATGKGVIRGLVIDETITPIADADIDIPSLGLATTSNENGLFAFNNLDPGAYFLTVSAGGYTQIQSAVQVEADVEKPDIVRIQLQRRPDLDPRVAYSFFAGYVGCSIQVANLVQDNVCGIVGGVDPDIQAPLEFGEEKAPAWLQTELQWDQTQVFGERLTIIQSMADGGGRIGNVWGSSPLTCRVGPDAPCNNGDGTGGGGTGLNGTKWTDKVDVNVYANCVSQCVPGTAVGLGLVLQQDYQVYGALFYNMDPLPDWRFVRDGEHPV